MSFLQHVPSYIPSLSPALSVSTLSSAPCPHLTQTPPYPQHLRVSPHLTLPQLPFTSSPSPALHPGLQLPFFPSCPRDSRGPVASPRPTFPSLCSALRNPTPTPSPAPCLHFHCCLCLPPLSAALPLGQGLSYWLHFSSWPPLSASFLLKYICPCNNRESI